MIKVIRIRCRLLTMLYTTNRGSGDLSDELHVMYVSLQVPQPWGESGDRVGNRIESLGI